MVFTPHSNVFKAADRLCICTSCQSNYGSCSLFKEFNLSVTMLNQVNLRSTMSVTDKCQPSSDPDCDDVSDITEYVVPDTYVAVAADSKSIDTVWFIKVAENNCISRGDDVDDYGHMIIENVKFNKGHFLERVSHLSNREIYKVSKKVTYFYSESVIYPFVDFKEEKKGLALYNDELSNIIHYIEENNFSHL